MEENLCGSELSIRTRVTCHIHLGEVGPPGKTIKNSEQPMTASQVAWVKERPLWQERDAFEWEWVNHAPKKEVVAFLEIEFLEISVLWKTSSFSGVQKRLYCNPWAPLLPTEVEFHPQSISPSWKCCCANNKIGRRMTTNQTIRFQEVLPSIL